MDIIPIFAIPELGKALHPRNLFYDTTQVDDSTFACQHVGDNIDTACVTCEDAKLTTPRTGSKFDRKVHYAATLRAEEISAEESTPLIDREVPQEAPERCPHSQRAYDDFLVALEKTGQLSPLPNDASSKAKKQRKLLIEKNRESILGFKRYLRHRSDASGFGGSRKKSLRYSWRHLRSGTVELLGKPRLAPLSGFQTFMIVTVLITLLFNLVVQARACLMVRRVPTNELWVWTSPLKPGVSEEEAHNYMVFLFIIFAIKEVFFVTFYLAWLLVVVVGLAIALALGTVSAALALVVVLPTYLIVKNFASEEWKKDKMKIMRKFMKKAQKNPLGLHLQRHVIKQASVIAHMALNLSNLYRIKEWVAGVVMHRARLVNFDVKLTSIANVIFDLGLMLCEGHDSDPFLVAAEVSVLALLFHDMVADEVEKRTLIDSIKDLNQNRLTKMETALLMTKLAEEVLHEPACYNFVEHFYTNPDQDPHYRLDYVPEERWMLSDGNALSADYYTQRQSVHPSTDNEEEDSDDDSDLDDQHN